MIRTLRVTVNGHEYDVTVEDRTDTSNQLYPQPGSMAPVPSPPTAGAAPPPVANAAPPTAAAGAVLAPMSGVVAEILVHQGQRVEPGDTVAVIEAMKMKTPIVVDHGGVVASIDAVAGDGVQVGQPIVTLA